jgi:hypothetical protein
MAAISCANRIASVPRVTLFNIYKEPKPRRQVRILRPASNRRSRLDPMAAAPQGWLGPYLCASSDVKSGAHRLSVVPLSVNLRRAHLLMSQQNTRGLDAEAFAKTRGRVVPKPVRRPFRDISDLAEPLDRAPE